MEVTYLPYTQIYNKSKKIYGKQTANNLFEYTVCRQA